MGGACNGGPDVNEGGGHQGCEVRWEPQLGWGGPRGDGNMGGGAVRCAACCRQGALQHRAGGFGRGLARGAWPIGGAWFTCSSLSERISCHVTSTSEGPGGGGAMGGVRIWPRPSKSPSVASVCGTAASDWLRALNPAPTTPPPSNPSIPSPPPGSLIPPHTPLDPHLPPLSPSPGSPQPHTFPPQDPPPDPQIAPQPPGPQTSPNPLTASLHNLHVPPLVPMIPILSPLHVPTSPLHPPLCPPPFSPPLTSAAPRIPPGSPIPQPGLPLLLQPQIRDYHPQQLRASVSPCKL